MDQMTCPVNAINTITERWHIVPGFYGFEASTEGRIRGPQGVIEPRLYKGRHLITNIKREDGKKTSTTVTRMVALAFLGPPVSAVDHAVNIDGDTLNNKRFNVGWMSRGASLARARARKAV